MLAVTLKQKFGVDAITDSQLNAYCCDTWGLVGGGGAEDLP